MWQKMEEELEGKEDNNNHGPWNGLPGKTQRASPLRFKRRDDGKGPFPLLS